MIKFRKDEFMKPLIYSTIDEYKVGCHIVTEIEVDIKCLQYENQQLKEQLQIKEDGQVTLNANKGIKWTTFITGIEMLIECIKENAETPLDIDTILADIKRIYERDRK